MVCVRTFRTTCTMLLILAATVVVLSAQTPTESDREQTKAPSPHGVCPVSLQLTPPSASNTLNVPNVPKYRTYRRLFLESYTLAQIQPVITGKGPIVSTTGKGSAGKKRQSRRKKAIPIAKKVSLRKRTHARPAA